MVVIIYQLAVLDNKLIIILKRWGKVKRLEVTEDGIYKTTNKKRFEPVRVICDRHIRQAFNFAYAMAFGEGEHRNHRTNGTQRRKNGQIFIDTFQGKISEQAIYYEFYDNNSEALKQLSDIDYEVNGLGAWDEADIVLGELKFSIKSTKSFGNMLLLETGDWRSDGTYIPNDKSEKCSLYDYFVLVRIEPNGESHMKKSRFLYEQSIEKEELFGLVSSLKWEYDIAGYITNEQLKWAIQNNFILPKNAYLNSKNVQMDAENYYFQSGDMGDFANLIKGL